MIEIYSKSLSESLENGEILSSWCLYIFHNGKYNRVSDLMKGVTANNAELVGIIRAIKIIGKLEEEVFIYTENKYILDALKGNIDKWRNSDWKLKSGKTINNRVELETLEENLKFKSNVVVLKGSKHLEILDKMLMEALDGVCVNSLKRNSK